MSNQHNLEASNTPKLKSDPQVNEPDTLSICSSVSDLQSLLDGPTESDEENENPRVTDKDNEIVKDWRLFLNNRPRSSSSSSAISNSSESSSDEDESFWSITDQQLRYYTEQFRNLQPDLDGLVPGHMAKPFFGLSHLPLNELSKIWQLADIDGDGSVTLNEFIIAMHLVVLRVNGVAVPDALPSQLNSYRRVSSPPAMLARFTEELRSKKVVIPKPIRPSVSSVTNNPLNRSNSLGSLSKFTSSKCERKADLDSLKEYLSKYKSKQFFDDVRLKTSDDSNFIDLNREQTRITDDLYETLCFWNEILNNLIDRRIHLSVTKIT